MNVTVETRYPSLPPVDRGTVLRFAGCPVSGEETDSVLENAVELICEGISPRVCFTILPLSIRGSICRLGPLTLESGDLAENLRGCSRAAVFAATVGVEADRLIIRYGRLLPSRGLMLDAVAAERTEALCDVFCAGFENARPRFSPGYGDLPLEVQRDIFAILDCPRRIGLTLNQSLLMSPSKSVTAIMGLE